MGWWFGGSGETHIAEATREDCAALADIHAAGFARNWDEEEIAAMLAMPGTTIWTARRGSSRNRPAGFAIVRQTGDEAEIITIATAPSARKAGIGRALMDHVIRQLQRDRIARLFLEVNEQNAAALALYRRLGFRQIGRREAYYPAQAGHASAPAAALVMQRELL